MMSPAVRAVGEVLLRECVKRLRIRLAENRCVGQIFQDRETLITGERHWRLLVSGGQQ